MIDDFRDLLRELMAANVQFLVVGAHALSVHGVPRATGDLDVWMRPDGDNAARLITALERFGAKDAADLEGLGSQSCRNVKSVAAWPCVPAHRLSAAARPDSPPANSPATWPNAAWAIPSR